jgi:hypothetical protein
MNEISHAGTPPATSDMIDALSRKEIYTHNHDKKISFGKFFCHATMITLTGQPVSVFYLNDYLFQFLVQFLSK